MISIPSTPPEGAIYPTDWHSINVLANTEVRQLSEDTFELRSASHTVVLNKVAFNLYRDGSEAGNAIFDNYCERNGLHAVPRTDK